MKTFLRITTILGLIAILILILITLNVVYNGEFNQERVITMYWICTSLSVAGLASAITIVFDNNLWKKADTLDIEICEYHEKNKKLTKLIHDVGLKYSGLKKVSK